MRRKLSRHFVASAEGARIAWFSKGAGPDVVFVNGLSADDFYWRPIVPVLESRARLIFWDLPGHGWSEPARRPRELTIAACADDLLRVLDAANIEVGTVVGFSLGCQIALEAWRHFPERINAVALILGTFASPFDNVLHPLVGPQIVRAIGKLGPRTSNLAVKLASIGTKVPGSFSLSRAVGVLGPRTTPDVMHPYFKHLAQLDGPSWAGLAVAAQKHSAAELLETIDVPVLIVSGGRDVFTPDDASAHMAEVIPGARHVHIEGAAHTGLVEHSELISSELSGFLDGLPSYERAHPAPRRPDVRMPGRCQGTSPSWGG
jgi:pimeloyl-ACP methyl ester carboxylesterase